MEKKLTKRQQQYLETMDSIRSAVDKLVAEIGFDSMRIQDICGEAGISVGAFYHYFASKNAVFVDRYRRRNAYYRKLYNEQLILMNHVDALKEFAAELLKYTQTRVPGVLRFYSKAIIDEYGTWNGEDGDAVLEICAALVERGQAEGTVSTLYEPKSIAMMFNDYYRGIMVSERISPGTDEEYEARRQVMFDWLETLRAARQGEKVPTESALRLFASDFI